MQYCMIHVSENYVCFGRPAVLSPQAYDRLWPNALDSFIDG